VRYLASWLFYVNFLLVQWFFVRLQSSGELVDGKYVHREWQILRWVVPLTGWFSNYVFIGKMKP
jgi:hypothetical protein